MNSLILYQSKYGATAQYATWLGDEWHLPVTEATDVNLSNLEPGSLLIIGSSVYIGKLRIAGWLKENEDQLNHHQLILFVVSGTPLNETEKLFQYVKGSVSPELFKRLRIFFLPGRLLYSKLSRWDRLMLRMGALFAGKENGAKMMSGYDNVKRGHLLELNDHIRPILSADRVSIY